MMGSGVRWPNTFLATKRPTKNRGVSARTTTRKKPGCLVLDEDGGPLLQPTFCIAAGGDFENRLAGGNDEN